MTDANTDGARMVAACTSGDLATSARAAARDAFAARQTFSWDRSRLLHYAVREGHASIVQLLLQHGALRTWSWRALSGAFH